LRLLHGGVGCQRSWQKIPQGGPLLLAGDTVAEAAWWWLAAVAVPWQAGSAKTAAASGATVTGRRRVRWVGFMTDLR
jgi:hypothetical protein